MSFFYVILSSEMTYKKRKKGLVLLADGTIFYGRSSGINGTSFGEICFNTGVTGYQEIFTDPSYFGQIMVTTTLINVVKNAFWPWDITEYKIIMRNKIADVQELGDVMISELSNLFKNNKVLN